MKKYMKVYLVTEKHTENEYGVLIPTDELKPVFAEVRSMTRAEWFNGGRMGLNPSFEFVVYQNEYSGQEIIQYNDERYTVYRTFERNDDLVELYTEKRKGNSGDKS